MKSFHDFDSVVTLESLASIRKHYNVLDEYILHAPGPGQRPYHPCPEGFSISVDALEVGLRFPLHPIIGVCLDWWRISPIQMAPNSWHYLITFLEECRGSGIVLTRDLFLSRFRLCKGQGGSYLTSQAGRQDNRGEECLRFLTSVKPKSRPTTIRRIDASRTQIDRQPRAPEHEAQWRQGGGGGGGAGTWGCGSGGGGSGFRRSGCRGAGRGSGLAPTTPPRRRPGPSTPPPSCSAAPPPASTSPTISPPDARTTALSLDQIQAAAARHADEQPAESSAAASDGEVATENHGLDESIINFMGMDSSADFPSLYEDFFFGFPAEAEPPPQEHDV
ncbi:hypothetical protein BHE74_00003303 [Ensete ventricosum]|nr:hypothetical protein BHE74_00003303 [Ensete ventricosum]